MPIPLDGIGLGAAGICSTEYGNTKICTTLKKRHKFNWVKVLKVLRGLLLKKSPKQGLGESPKVLTPQKEYIHVNHTYQRPRDSEERER